MRRLRKCDIKPTDLQHIYYMADTLCKDSFSPACGNYCCVKCCTPQPSITYIEFDYIAQYHDLRSPNVFIGFGPAYANKLASEIANMRPNMAELCPFLDKELCRCTVYDARPLECRLYNAIDKVLFENCPAHYKFEAANNYVIMRELLYRVLYATNGSNDELPVSTWLFEHLDMVSKNP